MEERIQSIDIVNESMNIKGAVIIMPNAESTTSLEHIMQQHDYPCGSKYHVLSEKQLAFAKHVLDWTHINLIIISRECDVYACWQSVPVDTQSSRFILCIN